MRYIIQYWIPEDKHIANIKTGFVENNDKILGPLDEIYRLHKTFQNDTIS